MTDEVTEEFTNEVNRLRARGLPTTVAMEVARGDRKEEFEVALWETRKRAADWAKLPESREAKVTPKWDYDPEHFYLSMDGATLPKQINPADFELVWAEVSDVTSHLASHSTRSEDPWSEEYEGTAEIAYRWAKGLPVTPPLISPHGEKITIVGGMHRFHLARHFATAQMPLLVRTSELQRLRSILKSATGLDGR